MPELPEVETIVRELKASVVGKTIMEYGLGISDVRRRGKFIIFILENDLRLVVHLRMTGRLTFEVKKGRRKYIRNVFNLSDGTKLYFSDVRKFGRVWFVHKDEMDMLTGIVKLGKEPLLMKFNDFKSILGLKKGILKNSLLRQDLIAGIGNIYADEICFRSGLHPSSRLEKLSKKDLKMLFESVVVCLKEGIKHCGVSVSDFVGTRGDLGKHQNYLYVYGRDGDPCYKCKNQIQKTRVAGRGTFFCSKCQLLKV